MSDERDPTDRSQLRQLLYSMTAQPMTVNWIDLVYKLSDLLQGPLYVERIVAHDPYQFPVGHPSKFYPVD